MAEMRKNAQNYIDVPRSICYNKTVERRIMPALFRQKKK